MSLIHDRAEVARIACANPGRMADAVMARFGIGRPRAQKLIHFARKAGFVIPSDAAIRVYDRAEVAKVAVGGVPRMGDAVAAHFGVSKTHAHRLIEMARNDGHDIPRVHRHPVTVVLKQDSRFAGLRLVCGCGEAVGLDFDALLKHTLGQHGRLPSVSEKTPQQVRREAA